LWDHVILKPEETKMIVFSHGRADEFNVFTATGGQIFPI